MQEESICEVDKYGTKFWYKDDKLHRLDGPAVEFADRYKAWYKDGKLHRKNGPAVEWTNGNKYWYIDDKRHRDDGPAVEYANGYKEYWYNNIKIECYSDEEYKRLLKLKAFWK